MSFGHGTHEHRIQIFAADGSLIYEKWGDDHDELVKESLVWGESQRLDGAVVARIESKDRLSKKTINMKGTHEQ